MVLVREMRVLFRALDLTKFIVSARKMKSLGITDMHCIMDDNNVSAATTFVSLPNHPSFSSLIGRCNHENKNFGTLQMLLVIRPGHGMLREFRCVFRYCYSKKINKKIPFRRQPFPFLLHSFQEKIRAHKIWDFYLKITWILWG